MMKSTTTSRRRFVVALAAAALGAFGGPALAAPPTVEIIAMKHPPVKAALKPLDAAVATAYGWSDYTATMPD